MKTKLRLLLLPLVLGGAALAAATVASSAGAASPCTGASCPVVTTTAPTSVTTDAVTFTGTVNPSGSATTCYFAYAPASEYSSSSPTTYPLRTADQVVTTGTPGKTPVPVQATVAGLEAQTQYDYALVCTNTAGAATGANTTVTTSDHGPSQIRLSGHTGFVDSNGMAGVFLGCYGDRSCTGFLTLTQGTTVIARRDSYTLRAGGGGIVHIIISAQALGELKGLGSYDVLVASTTTQGQSLIGGDRGRIVTLHIFR